MLGENATIPTIIRRTSGVGTQPTYAGSHYMCVVEG
jgi:hypothetical protein